MSEGVGVPHAPLFACGMTYPEAAVGIGIWGEARSTEHAESVGSSMTMDIIDTGALCALPGSRRKRAKRGARA